MIYIKKRDVLIRDSAHPDILPIATFMRKADVNEIWASHMLYPYEALVHGFENSKVCITAEHKGVPVMMAGVVPINEETASVWMLGTPEVDRLTVRFCKISRNVVSILLGFYPKLYNYVDVRNKKSIEWLKWCGAKFESPAPYGISKLPFQFFILEKN